MKVLVLGGEGMLGHKIFQIVAERFPTTACTVRGSQDGPERRSIELYQRGRVVGGVDAMDLSRVESVLRDLQPEFIINCVGVIKQRDEAKSPIPCIVVNSLLPHRLAEIAGHWGGRVIHFSTDCVFSGRKGAYTEDDSSDADDLYGKSKFLGEVAASNALTLRTSIIGRELSRFSSLLEWFLSQRAGRVRGFKRVIYSGVTTNYLANLVLMIIEQRPQLCGLYQVASAPISKYDLLCIIREQFGLKVEITADELEISDRSMVGKRFVEATGYECPTWPELIAQLAADPTPYEKWRLQK